MRRSVRIIDEALDHYVAAMGARGYDPEGFRLATLARAAGLENAEMSMLAQDYRTVQEEGVTKYVIACEGYGSNARWAILRKPGSDIMSIKRAKAKHARWVARDSFSRLIRDYAYELRPALRNSEFDRDIDAVVQLCMSNFENNLVFLETRIEQIFPSRRENGDTG